MCTMYMYSYYTCTFNVQCTCILYPPPPQVKLDEAQLSEQEALRKQLQQEQDLLQKFQESQEKKLLTQHDREKRALDEKVETSKRELEKRVSHPPPLTPRVM